MNELNLYPDIHNRLWSAVDEAAITFSGNDIDENQLNHMTQQVINRSGIMRNPPRGHSRQSIDDIIRFLLLCRITGRCPPFFPPFFPPRIVAPPMRPMPPMRPTPPMRPGQGNRPGNRPSARG